MSKWLVVGISGATSSGKTTVVQQLLKVLPQSTRLIQQDEYFYPEDSPKHVPSPCGMNHKNWDVITAMDMDRMVQDVQAVLSSSPSDDMLSEQRHHLPVLLLEGFLLFDDARIAELCDLKLFLTLPKDVCLERRLLRCYEPPDIPGYFESCVWPMYELYLGRVTALYQDVKFVKGLHEEQVFIAVMHEVNEAVLRKMNAFS